MNARAPWCCWRVIILIVILAFECIRIDGYYHGNITSIIGGGGRSLSRRKRYVSFPMGSSFAVSVCLTVGVLGNPNYQYISSSLNWGVAYELPNSTWALAYAHGFGKKGVTPESVVKRRHRRELYQKVELIIDRMGLNGRECILRSLCESRRLFTFDKMGIIPEVLRTIFSLPKTRIFTRELREHADIELYHRAYFSEGNCEYEYPCPFSLLDLGMGKYSEPSD